MIDDGSRERFKQNVSNYVKLETLKHTMKHAPPAFLTARQ